jgi:hypothetical protein
MGPPMPTSPKSIMVALARKAEKEPVDVTKF